MTSHDSGGIAYAIGRIRVMIWFSSLLAGSYKSRLRRNCLCLPIGRTWAIIHSLSSSSVGLQRWYTSYNSILVIVDQLQKMLHDEPMQIPIDAPGLRRFLPPLTWSSATESLGPLGTTFKPNCGYHLRIFYENIQESHDCMQKEPSTLAFDIANPIPPDL